MVLERQGTHSINECSGYEALGHFAVRGPLGRDERLCQVQASEILDWADVIVSDLDDLCVLLLFLVFEATVRERALADVAAELPALRHPALLHAARSLNEALEDGSFYKVTEAYKALDPDLIEQVNQVRKYSGLGGPWPPR